MVLVVGGWGAKGGLSSVEMLGRPSCNLSSLPFPLWGASALYTPGGQALVCGGHHNSSRGRFYSPALCLAFAGPYQDVYRDAGQVWSWRNSSSLTREEGWASAVVLREGSFLLGGRDRAKTSDFLPASSSSWVPGPSIPGVGARWACALPLDPHTLVVLAGDRTDQVLVFDARTLRWTAHPLLPALPTLFSPGCALHQGRILVSGGKLLSGRPGTSTWLVQPSTWLVTRAGDLVQGRAKHQLVEVKGRLVAVGGEAGRRHLASVEEWDGEALRWSTSSMRLREGRNGHVLLQIPGREEDFCRAG